MPKDDFTSMGTQTGAIKLAVASTYYLGLVTPIVGLLILECAVSLITNR